MASLRFDMMALTFSGKTPCPICKQVIAEKDDTVSFPAFLPPDHKLSGFSDAAFHRNCFEAHEQAADVLSLYERYRTIWDSRPKNLKTIEDMEQWGREAFKDFP